MTQLKTRTVRISEVGSYPDRVNSKHVLWNIREMDASVLSWEDYSFKDVIRT